MPTWPGIGLRWKIPICSTASLFLEKRWFKYMICVYASHSDALKKILNQQISNGHPHQRHPSHQRLPPGSTRRPTWPNVAVAAAPQRRISGAGASRCFFGKVWQLVFKNPFPTFCVKGKWLFNVRVQENLSTSILSSRCLGEFLSRSESQCRITASQRGKKPTCTAIEPN